MSLLLALQGVTGSGASAITFSDSGTGLEIFEGSGASLLTLIDAGTGVVAVDIIGDGASQLVLTDVGSGIFTEVPTTQPNGGGWVYRDRDRGKTVKAFKRILQPKRPERTKRQVEKQRTPDVFSYVSESEIAFASTGHGTTRVTRQGAGASNIRFASHGKGHFEESAADLIRLLLAMDEI
jgi:hypothetical protein